jgi:SPX domain protein involved in polyphosphate accumulation
MKFGTTLRKSTYAPWAGQYIDYDKLKTLLRERDDDKPWTSDDVTAFTDELANVQLEKVYNFKKDTAQKLRERTTACEKKLEPLAIGIKSEESKAKDMSNGAPSYAEVAAEKPEVEAEEKERILQDVRAELDDITKEVKELETYSRINYTAVIKATKKHDKLRGRSYRLRPFINARLAEKPIYTEDHSPLVYRLSAMYSFVRQSLEGKSKEALSFTESTTGGEDSTSYKCKNGILHTPTYLC